MSAKAISSSSKEYEEFLKSKNWPHPKDVEWFKCEVCGKKCATDERRTRHMNAIHSQLSSQESSDPKNSDRPMRELNVLTEKENLHPTKQIAQGGSNKSALQYSGKDSIVLAPSSGDVFQCLACPFTCNTNADLMRHSQKHKGMKPYQCKICFKRFSQKGNLRPHMRLHERKEPHCCEYCQKVFNHKSALMKHVREHESNRVIQCSLCHYTCDTLHKREQHELKEHKCSIYLCPSCPSSFGHIELLETHINEIHPQLSAEKAKRSPLIAIKRWCCQYCDKNFTTRSYLKIHHKIHLGEKPYVCQICEFRAVSKDSIKKHISRSHKKGKHVCSDCDKRFRTLREMKLHMKEYHSGSLFICHMCSKRFRDQDKLENHLELHRKGPCYKCDMCNVSYLRASTLKKHNEQHLDDCIPCNVCGRQFWTKFLYKRHILNHTKDKVNIFDHYQDLSIKVELDTLPDGSISLHKLRDDFKENEIFIINEFEQESIEANIKYELQETVFCCQFCDGIYESEEGLLTHIEESHQEVDVAIKLEVRDDGSIRSEHVERGEIINYIPNNYQVQ